MVQEKGERAQTPSRESLIQHIQKAVDPIGCLKEAGDAGYYLPKHIVVIPDGNGRWAERNSYKSVTEGHKKGMEVMVDIMRDSLRLFPHVQSVTLWALSPDNIRNRSKDEVAGLMHVIHDALLDVRDELHEKNGRIIHIGEKEGLADFLQKTLAESEEMTKDNTGPKITLAVNFNGDQDQLRIINEAISHAQEEGLQKIDMQTFQKLQDPYSLGPANLIIRTGSEVNEGKSLSGLGLDKAGTQLAFTPTLLPDFTSREFATHIAQYQKRRMGGRPSDTAATRRNR